jgi:hypothetical protein
VRTVARWGLASSAIAPVLLIGGWTLADALQHAPFDPVRQTISALAARDADPRWVMTAALIGVGLCHLTTAAAVRPAGLPGRLLLGVGGAATLGVAAAPLPAGGGGSAAHTAFAGTAFLALASWPAFGVRRRRMDGGRSDAGRADAGRADAGRADAGRADAGRADAGSGADSSASGSIGDVAMPWRPAVALPVTALLLALVVWFGVELSSDVRVGLAERVAAGAQTLWPAIAVRLARR